MEEYITKSELETKEIAYNFATTLKVGDIVVLSRRFRCWKNKIYRRVIILLEFTG